MQRFFIKDLNTSNYTLVIRDKEIIKQILKVLRMTIWDKVIFFDWKDLYDYIFEIKEISKIDITLEQISRKEKNTEIYFELNLFQALPNKLDKIEFIIKNGTQIWISNFLFFKAQRSQRINISYNKQERFKKIIIESCEQCGRNTIPNLVIWEKINFSNLEWTNVFFHTDEKNSKNIDFICSDKNKTVNLFTWPEWWFSDEEIDSFTKNWFEKVFLWKNILRTELSPLLSSFYLINKKNSFKI